MKFNYCITYDEALDAGTDLIDHWLDSIKNGFFTFSTEFFKERSIENLTRAKEHLIEKYRNMF